MSTPSKENSDQRPISPSKLSHVVLRAARLNEMLNWYVTVLTAQGALIHHQAREIESGS